MRRFKHHSGATIFVYPDGKKVIEKYGIPFQSFKHLKLYEKDLDPNVKAANDGNFKRDVYREHRYK